MKKKLKKELTHLLPMLPVTVYERIVHTRVSGEQLLKDGIETVEGREVKDHLTYTQTKIIPTKLDHMKKLQKYHQTHGKEFINKYTEWLKLHHFNMVNKYPHLFKIPENA